MTRLVPLIATALLFGCVAQAEYDSALTDLDTARKAHGSLEEQLAHCRTDLANAGHDPGLSDRLAAGEAELEELRLQREAAEKQLEAFRQLNDKLAELIAAGDLEVYVRNGLPVIALPSEVLFGSGKAELSSKGERSLAKVAAALESMNTQRIQIAGHTDNMPIGKKSEWADNWQLSSARALTVTRFLIQQGLGARKLSAAGYGEFDPVKTNGNASGRKKNRRIELVLLPDLSDLQPVSTAAK